MIVTIKGISFMLNELNTFKVDKFKAFIASKKATDEDVLKLVSITLSRPEIIFIHDDKKRLCRNSFISEIKYIVKDYNPEIISFIINKENVINTSEFLFDEIKKEINDCEISKEASNIQIWSHIGRAIAELNILNDNSKNPPKPSQKYTLLSPYKRLKNANGDAYDPDGVLEKCIQYLSITLLLLSYKYKWLSEEMVIIPDKVSVEDSHINNSGNILMLAISWRSLEDISQRCIMFDGSVNTIPRDEIPTKYIEKGLKNAFLYERDESEFEVFDAISCERVRKKHLQDIIELNSSASIKSTIADDLSKLGKINEFSFISIDEVYTCQQLNDIFCTDILTENVELHGIELFNWVRGYYIINYLSKLVFEHQHVAEFEKNEIISFFEQAGIEINKAILFIDLISFSKNSQDLFDCPLIKINNDKYHLAYYAFLTPVISRVILSRLSSLNAQISDKGYKFENETRCLITKKLSPCKEFKFKRDSDEYEYDGVFIVDNKIFLLECKNRSLSWYNPVKTYRNRSYMFDTIKQITRLKNALIKYPDVIKEHFNVDVSQYEIIPVIYNCIPFSWKGKINGVYVTDNSSISRFLKSKRINLVITSRNGQRHVPQKKLTLWNGNKPNSDDIIKQLENPIQLAPFLNSRKKVIYPRPASKKSIFFCAEYEVDADAYEKEEMKLFSISKNKAKKKKR